MKTLIFADVHLKVDAANRDYLVEFVRFLRSIDPAEIGRVVVVGDLFDFWFEYRHVVFSGYFDVLRALADLREAGVEFHLICGNHDFWAGRFFERDLGFQVHREEFLCRLGDRTALFIHGDGVNPADTGYRLYKRIARSPIVVWLFRLVHPDWAMALAQRLSSASRSRQDVAGRARRAEVEASRAYARGVIASGRADLVICGHTHVVAHEEFPNDRGAGTYINTGGWLEERAYWLWDGAALGRYQGLLTERRPAPVSQIEQRQHAELGAIDVARQEADQA
jgi:UDP-2,3-diacylglucosamine hydrolase